MSEAWILRIPGRRDELKKRAFATAFRGGA